MADKDFTETFGSKLAELIDGLTRVVERLPTFAPPGAQQQTPAAAQTSPDAKVPGVAQSLGQTFGSNVARIIQGFTQITNAFTAQKPRGPTDPDKPVLNTPLALAALAAAIERLTTKLGASPPASASGVAPAAKSPSAAIPGAFPGTPAGTAPAQAPPAREKPPAGVGSQPVLTPIKNTFDTFAQKLSQITNNNTTSLVGGQAPVPGTNTSNSLTQNVTTAAGATAGGPGFAGIAAGLGGLATVVTAAVGALEQAVASVKGFVEALNPGTIRIFDQEVRNLQATLGVAFQPIFEILTGTFREIAGIILPLMEQLRPVIAEVVGVFADSLVESVKMTVDAISALMPVIQVLVTAMEILNVVFVPLNFLITGTIDALKILLSGFSGVTEGLKVVKAFTDGFAEVFRVLQAVFGALADTLSAFVGGLFGVDFTALVDQIRGAFKLLISQLLIFVATLAKFFGANAFLANLINRLEPKEGQKAAGPVSIKSTEQIVKELALSSAIAAEGGAEKKFDLSDVVKELKEIQDGTSDGNSSVVSLLERISGYLETISNAKQAVDTFVPPVAAGLAAGGLPGAAFSLGRRLIGG